MTLESDVWRVRSPNWTANSSVATLRHLPEGNAPDCTHSVQSSGAGPLPQNKLNNTSSPSLSLTSVNQTASNLITEIVTVLQAMLIKSDGQLSLSAGSTSTGDPFPPSSSQRSRENELDSMHPSLNGESLSTRLNMLISSLKTLWDNSEPDPGDSLHSAQSKSESSAFLWHSSDISVEPQDLCTLTNTIHYLVSHNKGVTRALSLLPDATRRSLEASIQCLGIICQSCHLPLPQAEASEFDISHSTTGGGATAESGENPHLTRAPEQFGCTDPLHRRGAYKVVTSDEHPSHMAHPPSSQAIPFPSSIVDADNNNNNERGYELHNEAKGDRVKAISFDDRMSNVSLSSSDESLEGNDTRQSSVLTSSSRSGSVPSLTMTVSSTYTGTVETVCDTVRDVPATITIGKSRRQRVGSLISFSRAFLPSPPASPTILESSQYQYQKSNLVRESPVFDITPVDAIHMAYTLHKSPLAQEVITPGEVESIWSTTSTTPSVVTRLRHDSLFLPLPSFVFWDRASVAEPEDIRSEMDAKNQNAQHCSPAKDALSKIHSKTGSLTGPTPQNEAGASTASSHPHPHPFLHASGHALQRFIRQ
ncbi:uncharacterized protein EI90DRAFT_2505165 [Cantharellus anzutake]|uniref:uncharacterized protein n=1 Tax=Cantharellus anzutake TaxID=1750568 RepID=UPI00190509D7|nr:uncharacterized protein EI90DRAFT_2505165 [Cantharellus anzutake]KAF8321489.1 hypothetical protein EI90DRAFT_2505165 [Cantharellus anzutake]